MKPAPSLVLAVLLVLATVAPATAGIYTITDLGTLGGNSSAAFGLNNLGQVVGTSLTAGGQTHAFLYSGGVMTDLGVLSPSENYSMASRINDKGQVVGFAAIQDSQGNLSGDLPFLYSGGTMTNLGSLGGVYGVANDINNSGDFVGNSASTGGAFLDANGTVTSLGHFASSYVFSDAFGVNNLGQVTGYSTTGSGAGFEHPFLYSSGVLTDLGTLGGNSARAFDINDAGQIAGASFIATNDAEHAFIYSGGTMHDLGTLNAKTSQALAINNNGDAVGTLVYESTGAQNRGFLYQNGVMVDVNSLLPANSGWVLRDAQDINDLGQIVGFGEINGQDHAYLLTPVPEPASAIVWLTIIPIALAAYRINRSQPQNPTRASSPAFAKITGLVWPHRPRLGLVATYRNWRILLVPIAFAVIWTCCKTEAIAAPRLKVPPGVWVPALVEMFYLLGPLFARLSGLLVIAVSIKVFLDDQTLQKLVYTALASFVASAWQAYAWFGWPWSASGFSVLRLSGLCILGGIGVIGFVWIVDRLDPRSLGKALGPSLTGPENPGLRHPPAPPAEERNEAGWYITSVGDVNVYGPILDGELNRYIREGTITQDTLIWRQGWPEEWQWAGTVFPPLVIGGIPQHLSSINSDTSCARSPPGVSAFSWPLVSHFSTMLQYPEMAFRAAELRSIVVEYDEFYQPRAWSGEFATVFKGILPDGSPLAIRVFAGVASERRERYQAIASYLQGRKVEPLVGFTYRDDGIRSAGDGKFYPLVTMEWVAGETLFEWVARQCQAKNRKELAKAAELWVELVGQLTAAQIAHGNLEHSNIMVTDRGRLKLVDYDCMCVPALVGRTNLEIGIDPYQHPARDRETKLSLSLDNYSALFILAALRALAAAPELWNYFVEGPQYDKLLFRREDLDDPNRSELIKALRRSSDPNVPRFVGALIQLRRAPLEAVPDLGWLLR